MTSHKLFPSATLVVPESEASDYERFDLGAVYATPGAMALGEDLTPYLRRHHCEDWGDLDAEDQQSNKDALASQSRLLSAYQTQSGERLYIITEWDRSRTTVLLASEY